MGTVSQASRNMKAFVIVALVAAVSYAAAYPYAHAGVYYGKREAEAEPWTVGQIAAGAHVAEAIKDGRAHNVGVITNAAIAPVAATHVYSAYPYAHYPYAYYGKREAEAEADPALVYSTVGAVPYPYGVLPYAGVHGPTPVHAVAHT